MGFTKKSLFSDSPLPYEDLRSKSMRSMLMRTGTEMRTRTDDLHPQERLLVLCLPSRPPK